MTSSMRRRAWPMRWRQSADQLGRPGDAVGEAVDVDVGALQLAQDGVELVERLGVAGFGCRMLIRVPSASGSTRLRSEPAASCEVITSPTATSAGIANDPPVGGRW